MGDDSVLKQAWADIRSIVRTCRGPLSPESAKIKNALLADGRLEEAAAENEAGRPGCGFDINDIICAGPLDGQSRVYVCPKCGNTGEYTPPLIAVES